jgi:hypothetical protein
VEDEKIGEAFAPVEKPFSPRRGAAANLGGFQRILAVEAARRIG